jgi:excisionase family DNA binding protein
VSATMPAKEPTKDEGLQLLTVDDVARACNVSDKTVRRWIRDKALVCTLVGPAKRIRITRGELQRVMGGAK